MPNPISTERFRALSPLEQRIIRDRQNGRRELRRMQQRSVRIGATQVYGTMTGGVFDESGLFERARVAKHRDLVYRVKKPTDDNRWCAIEIEMLTEGNNDTVVDALCAAGVARYVHLKDDGSLSGTDRRPNEHELVVCAPLDEMPGIIDRVCEALHRPEVNAGVNKTCGLHIHLDMRNDDEEKAFRNLVYSYEPLLSKLVPETRLRNTYCQPPTTADFEDAQSNDDRYMAINPCAYNTHTTLEVRLFAGSVNADKIKQYLAIVSSIAYAPALARGLSTADQWGQRLEWTPNLTSWVKTRAQDFHHAL